MGFVASDEKLWMLLEAIVKDEGLQLYDLETLGSGGLKVTIDRVRSSDATTPEGVSSGDCSLVCRRLMLYFQVDGATLGFGAEPQIEVSSPGINRQLRLPQHFQSAAGERVKIVSQASGSSDTRTYIGLLKLVDYPKLHVEDETSGEAVEIVAKDVKRAQVEYKFQ